MATRNESNVDALWTAQRMTSECVGARVRTLNRVITRIYDKHLRELGLKFSQMNILTSVTLRGPISPGRVAQILGIEKSTLSRNVRILESNGWIESRPGEVGNSLLLSATPKGRRLLQKASPSWREAQEEVTSLLGDRTTAAIRRGFDRVQELETEE